MLFEVMKELFISHSDLFIRFEGPIVIRAGEIESKLKVIDSLFDD